MIDGEKSKIGVNLGWGDSNRPAIGEKKASCAPKNRFYGQKGQEV